MKKNTNIFYVISILTMLVITSVGCKKDKSEPTKPTMSAKIDGVAWSPDSITGELEKLPGFDSKEMSIRGGFTDNKLIELTIIEKTSVGDGIAVGTYDMTSGIFFGTTLSFAEYFPSGFTNNYPSPFEGRITVTKSDPTSKTISGTFNAKIDKSSKVISITDGVFTDVSYTIK